MRFLGYVVISSAVVLGACGGGDKKADTTATAAPAVTDTAATAAPATTTGAMAPVTGTTHEVKMIGDTKGFRFEPANITVKAGDGIKFLNMGGGPHNVAFDATSVPADVKSQLNANFGADKDAQMDLSSKLTGVAAGDAITISFANIAPGTYNIFCLPHKMMGMTGKITVQ